MGKLWERFVAWMGVAGKPVFYLVASRGGLICFSAIILLNSVTGQNRQLVMRGVMIRIHDHFSTALKSRPW